MIADKLAMIKEQIAEHHRPTLENAAFINNLFWRYKKALEDLTPSGSEFVNDPEYCAEFVRDRQRNLLHVLAEQKKQASEDIHRLLSVIDLKHQPRQAENIINRIRFRYPKKEEVKP